jgi:hypothetical protein
MKIKKEKQVKPSWEIPYRGAVFSPKKEDDEHVETLTRILLMLILAAEPIVCDDDGSGPTGCKVGTC